MNQPNKPIWRQILSRKFWQCGRHGPVNGSLTLELDCGHESHRKASQDCKGIRVRCKMCESLRDGGGTTTYRNRIEIWDEATRKPKIILHPFQA